MIPIHSIECDGRTITITTRLGNETMFTTFDVETLLETIEGSDLFKALVARTQEDLEARGA